MEYKFNCPYLEMYPPIEVLKPCQASAPITFSENRKKIKTRTSVVMKKIEYFECTTIISFFQC